MRLDKTDAKYVQVITTCKGILGCALDSGSQTFLPDDGDTPQAPCPLLQLQPENTASCSHGIATIYFRLSLNPAIKYKARKCSSWILYAFGFCWNGDEDVMGYYAKGTSGNFYLKLKQNPPYI